MPIISADLDPIYRLRAMEMLKLRVLNWPLDKIAKQYGCCRETVVRALAWAKRQGLATQYENQILADLVPKAIRVYSTKLDEGDEFIAKDVIDKLVKLGDRFSQRETSQEEVGLKAYLEEKRSESKKLEAKPVGAVSTRALPPASTVAAGFISTNLSDLATDGKLDPALAEALDTPVDTHGVGPTVFERADEIDLGDGSNRDGDDNDSDPSDP